MKDTTVMKSWAEDDRPREKMLNLGRHNLSVAELLSIVIGSGSARHTALDLAQMILADHENNLAELSRKSVRQLQTYHGIGEAKAIAIVAAMELGRRRTAGGFITRQTITSSNQVAALFRPRLSDLEHEEFWLLLLDRANQFIKEYQLSKGGVSGTVVDCKLIFKKAIEHTASSVILCHNHPSGNVKPSAADISLTRKIKQAGILLDIAVLDHIVIAADKYYSFADENMI